MEDEPASEFIVRQPFQRMKKDESMSNIPPDGVRSASNQEESSVGIAATITADRMVQIQNVFGVLAIVRAIAFGAISYISSLRLYHIPLIGASFFYGTYSVLRFRHEPRIVSWWGILAARRAGLILLAICGGNSILVVLLGRFLTGTHP